MLKSEGSPSELRFILWCQRTTEVFPDRLKMLPDVTLNYGQFLVAPVISPPSPDVIPLLQEVFPITRGRGDISIF